LPAKCPTKNKQKHNPVNDMNNFLPIAVPNVAVNQFIALPSIGKSLSRPNHLPLAGRSKFKEVSKAEKRKCSKIQAIALGHRGIVPGAATRPFHSPPGSGKFRRFTPTDPFAAGSDGI
ncbi:MAG: hypothetical protein WCZ16_08540, partial [Desulfosarcinaceae bacterium]